MGVLGLLLLFEFISMFMHPYIAHFTHETPVLILLISVGIASVLAPVHHKLEHWWKQKLTHKRSLHPHPALIAGQPSIPENKNEAVHVNDHS